MIKKALFTLMVCCFFAVCLHAQESIAEFGKVSFLDLTHTYNLKDKDAPACVVHESGRYFFSVDETGTFIRNRFHREVYIRIHILKQAGIGYADLEIPYYSATYDVDDVKIEGFTYNLGDNDMVICTPLAPASILDEKVSDNIYRKKIAMPDVREGSIVELRYRQSTSYFYMPAWYFQKDIPVLYSELVYQESPNVRYAMISKGTDRFDIYEVEDEHSIAGASFTSGQTLQRYRYVMRNMRAFDEDVDFLRNAVDYRVAIYPQLAYSRDMNSKTIREHISSWPIMRKDLLSHGDFGRYIRSVVKETKDIVEGPDFQGLDEAGKIEAIVRYVRNNYTWDGGSGKYASKKLSAFLKEKTGNAGNLNLFLAGMLQAAGIESYPVILRSVSDGTINKSYAFVNLFNFVVVQAVAGGKTYYLDATDTLCPFDMVSLDCINAEGLVLKPKTEEWAVITNPHPSVSFAALTLTIDPVSGSVSGDVARSYSGLDAVVRRGLYGDDPERLEAMFESADYLLGEVSAEDYSNINNPFKIKYGFEAELDEPDADKIFIDPMAHLAPRDNIFRETQRQYPVDFVARSTKSYSVSIAIPEGYTLEHLPASKNIDNREVSMIYSTNEHDGTITVNAQFTFKNAVYPASDYNMLKKYYADMITTFSENIILRKK